MLQVINTGISTAEENMEFDAKLLEELDPQGKPILHLYDWKGLAGTYGYFIRPERHLNLEKAATRGVSFARRATGGGIVFHIWDLAFSFLLPSGHKRFSLNTLENYQFVNRAVLEAVGELFGLKGDLAGEEAGGGGDFCMAKPTVYDVMHQGMKIAGAAQRKKKQGYLHQGTISLAAPDMGLLQELLLDQGQVAEAMKMYTFAPVKQQELAKTRKEMQNRLAENLMRKLY